MFVTGRHRGPFGGGLISLSWMVLAPAQRVFITLTEESFKRPKNLQHPFNQVMTQVTQSELRV